MRAPWRGRGVAKALIVSSMRAHRERGMDFAALGSDAGYIGAAGLARREYWAARTAR